MFSKVMPTILAAGMIFVVAGCKDTVTADDKNNQARDRLMERATAKVPVPEVNNFLVRQYIAEWMRRMDDPSKVFYIYLFADTGNAIGYYVGTRPVSLCSLMTPPEKKWKGDWNRYGSEALGPAPTLSGVYGSGGGGCDTYYFFDAETDALIHFSGFNYFTADEPLGLDAEPIRVQSSK